MATEHDPFSKRSESADSPSELATFVRVGVQATAQVLGMLLVLVGLYCCLTTFFQAYAALREPEKLESAVVQMTKLAGLENVEAKFGPEANIPIGRAAGLIATGAWTVICVWIAVALLTAGGRLVWGPGDQSQLRSFLRELLSEVRRRES
jgi:hypothetical protein